MTLSTGQVLLNRYRIVKLLGSGGFGAVYRAWDLNMERPRALKENFDTSPEAQRQFKREAQILADLTHPNLPKVIDHFTIPDQGQYLVMEYVDGEDLQHLLDATPGGLPEAQVLPWILQICDVLSYLHRQNPAVIHRDIKPANIKITSQGKAILVDFGIAKAYDPQVKTTLGARAGTPGYSPIEQYGLGATDARSDIYSLAATLYALLTGTPPLEAPQRAVKDTLTTARELNPTVSLQVSQTLQRALAQVPDQRWDSVEAFAAGLRAESPRMPAFQPQPAARVAPAPSPVAPTSVVAPASPPSIQPKKSTPWWTYLLGGLAVIVIGFFIWLASTGGFAPKAVVIPPQPPAATEEPAEVAPATTEEPAPTEVPLVGICADGSSYQLTLWHYWDDSHWGALSSFLQEYAAANPCVVIDSNKPEEMQSGLNNAIAAGAAPDIIVWANERIGRLVLDGTIVNLEWFGVDPSYLTNTYEPAAVTGVKYQDSIYGLPVAQEGIALIYNKSLVKPQYLPRDPLNFQDLQNKATDYLNTTGIPMVCNPAFGVADAYHPAPIYFGFGVPFYVDVVGDPYLNTTEALDAARWIQQFSGVTLSEATYDVCLSSMQDGSVGMWWTGPWAIPAIQEAGIDFGILPMGRPFVGIRTLMLTQASVDRGNAEAAVDVMKYLTSAEVQKQLALETKTIPAATAALHDPQVSADPVIAGFGAALNLGVPMSSSVYSGCQWGPVGDATLAVVNGAMQPQEAMDFAQKGIEDCVAGMR